MVIEKRPIEERLLAQLRTKLKFLFEPLDHSCAIDFEKITEMCGAMLEDYKQYLTSSVKIIQLIQWTGDIVGLAEDGRVYQYDAENKHWIQI